MLILLEAKSFRFNWIPPIGPKIFKHYHMLGFNGMKTQISSVVNHNGSKNNSWLSYVLYIILRFFELKYSILYYSSTLLLSRFTPGIIVFSL